MRIRRSGAYGVAGAIVLVGSQFLPMSTPDWYGRAVFWLVCALAGAALSFHAQERRAGEAKRSIGFFTLVVLLLLFTLLGALPLVL